MGEQLRKAEFRRLDHGEEYRDEFALADEWDMDGTPTDHATEWRGYKGDFFSLFYAVNRFARREFPELVEESDVGERYVCMPCRDLRPGVEGAIVVPGGTEAAVWCPWCGDAMEEYEVGVHGE